MNSDLDSTHRVRLDLAYDGTDFAGWARQPGLRTVQGEIESALETFYGHLGAAPTLVVAGRTDAGVHALGQVAHCDLSASQYAKIDVDHIARSLNGILAASTSTDIVIVSSTAAQQGFDARFSALWRHYEYLIADAAAARNPLLRRSVTWHPKELDLRAMNDAAHALLGLHDWAAFCKSRERATTVRTLQEFEWLRRADGVLEASVKADAFCHSMVRSLVGACVAIGEGRFNTAELLRLRDERVRTSAFIVMPSRGLTLKEVGYPAAEELGVRAEQTRAFRSLIPLSPSG